VLSEQLEQLEIQKAQAESQRRQALETAKEVCTEAEGNGSLDYVNDLFRRELGQDAADEDVAACMEADRLEDELKKVLKEVHRQEGRAGGTLDELEVPSNPASLVDGPCLSAPPLEHVCSFAICAYFYNFRISHDWRRRRRSSVQRSVATSNFVIPFACWQTAWIPVGNG
jgi:Arc/MetJ family transcription regulator